MQAMFLPRLVLAIALLAALGPLTAGLAWADDEDNTPQVDDFLETRRYTDAATRQVLGQFSYVVGEVDRYPALPTPEYADQSELRKRLLNLRLMMDFNAFAYERGSVDRWRDLVDEAYEAVGQYKDLYEVNERLGLPIDNAERDRRFNDMLNAVAPFRQADIREKFQKAYDRDEKQPVALDAADQPRLWRLAGSGPTDNLDSAGNAARLGQDVLRSLQASGLLVDDIADPAQEARFHDVRKALRSVLILSDMFPSLAEAVGEAREPLADLVKAYGKVNEQIVAYNLARSSGQDLEPRAAALRKEFAKAQDRAREFAASGELEAYVDALAAARAAHQR
jgi:hypothetical protein